MKEPTDIYFKTIYISQLLGEAKGNTNIIILLMTCLINNNFYMPKMLSLVNLD